MQLNPAIPSAGHPATAAATAAPVRPPARASARRLTTRVLSQALKGACAGYTIAPRVDPGSLRRSRSSTTARAPSPRALHPEPYTPALIPALCGV